LELEIKKVLTPKTAVFCTTDRTDNDFYLTLIAKNFIVQNPTTRDPKLPAVL
jgi:hypothetical protein